MARRYSTKSASRRWPVQGFFNILDIGAINLWMMYNEIGGINKKRRDFILNLAGEYVQNMSPLRHILYSIFTPYKMMHHYLRKEMQKMPNQSMPE